MATVDGSSFAGQTVQCVSGETSETTIDGFRIIGADQDGQASGTTHDGGLFVLNSSPTVVNCMFEEYAADFGGAIYCRRSDATIVACVFRNTTCSEKGGTLRRYDSAPTIASCRFTSHSAFIHGGAIANNESSDVVIGQSTFCENDPDDMAGPWIDGGGNVLAGVCCHADLFDDVVDMLALLAL